MAAPVSPHHVCLPLLALAQRASAVLIDADAGTGDAATPHATTTGAQLLHRTALMSRALSACAPPGSVVALVAQAGVATFEAMLAALDAGCILCPLNWRWTEREVAEALARVSPAVVLHDGACAELARAALAAAHLDPTPRSACATCTPAALHNAPQTGAAARAPGGRAGVPWAALGQPPLLDVDEWRRQHLALERGRGAAAPLGATEKPSSSLSAATTPSSPTPPAAPQLFAPPPPPELQLRAPPCGSALLVFTSGTTAAPKGVLLSHASFHAQSLAKLAVVGYAPHDTYLHLAPLFHIGGLSSAFAALMAGCTHVFLPRFEPGAALRAIVRQRVTAFIAVPTMLKDLSMAAATAGLGASAAPAEPAAAPAKAAKAAKAAAAQEAAASGGGVTCVRRILVGAGGTSQELQDAVARTFPCAELMSAYGMTEACSSMTFLRLRGPASPPHPAPHPGSAARPAAGSSTPPTVSSRAPSGARSQAAQQSPQQPRPQPQPPAQAAEGAGVPVGWPAPGVQVVVARSAEGAAVAGGSSNSGLPSSSGGTGGEEEEEGGRGSGSGGAGAGVGLGANARPGPAQPTRAAPCEAGELLTRGPHVMVGYWRDAGATAQALLPGGWLRTGDLGYVAEDGCVWLLGRAKDMVKSGGENVFAPQVEAALCEHPAVAAAAVVGLPDERLGEQVAALVVLREGWAFNGPRIAAEPTTPSSAPSGTPSSNPSSNPSGAGGASAAAATAEGGGGPQAVSLAALQAHCRSLGLAGYRLPRFVAAQAEPLPTNSAGKVQKPAVREVLAAARGGGERSRL